MKHRRVSQGEASDERDGRAMVAPGVPPARTCGEAEPPCGTWAPPRRRDSLTDRARAASTPGRTPPTEEGPLPRCFRHRLGAAAARSASSPSPCLPPAFTRAPRRSPTSPRQNVATAERRALDATPSTRRPASARRQTRSETRAGRRRTAIGVPDRPTPARDENSRNTFDWAPPDTGDSNAVMRGGTTSTPSSARCRTRRSRPKTRLLKVKRRPSIRL